MFTSVRITARTIPRSRGARDGAIVFERHDTHVGKGYVLNDMLRRIPPSRPAGTTTYLVLDADNILDPELPFRDRKGHSAGLRDRDLLSQFKTMATTGSLRAMRCGSCARAQYLNNARSAAAARCPAQDFCSLTVLCCGAVGGTSSCSRRTSIYHRQRDPWGKKSAMRAVRCSMIAAHELCPVWRRAHALVEGGICRSFASTPCSSFSGIAHGAFPAMTDDEHHACGSADGVSVIVNIGAALSNAAVRRRLMRCLMSAMCKRGEPVCETLFVLGAITTVTGGRTFAARRWKKVLLCLYVPALHAHLCAHLYRFALYEGRVEANLSHESDDAQADRKSADCAHRDILERGRSPSLLSLSLVAGFEEERHQHSKDDPRRCRPPWR